MRQQKCQTHFLIRCKRRDEIGPRHGVHYVFPSDARYQDRNQTRLGLCLELWSFSRLKVENSFIPSPFQHNTLESRLSWTGDVLGLGNNARPRNSKTGRQNPKNKTASVKFTETEKSFTRTRPRTRVGESCLDLVLYIPRQDLV